MFNTADYKGSQGAQILSYGVYSYLLCGAFKGAVSRTTQLFFCMKKGRRENPTGLNDKMSQEQQIYLFVSIITKRFHAFISFVFG